MTPQTIFLFFMELDKNLAIAAQNYGIFIYPLLFIIIFAETGLVVTPFLPGDSLLFAAGAIAALGSLNVVLLFFIIFLAAILGDNANYWIGRFIGPRVFRENSRLFKKEYLIKTRAFYEKHGVKTVIIARFMPIIRTFAPFVAGIGQMRYLRFFVYDLIGGLLWVGVFIFGGYFFGQLSIIKNNFSLFIILIIIISLLPMLIGLIRAKLKKSHATS